MKSLITFTMLALCVHLSWAQTDDLGLQAVSNTDRSPALENLYEQAIMLENSGSAALIEANRLAIKEAWEVAHPEVAALYKPLDNKGILPETEANFGANGSNAFAQNRERDAMAGQNRDWDTDRLLLDDWVDGGVDMEVTSDGAIYISAFQNDIENEGATFDEIIIFRSLDGGVTFEEWQRENVTAAMRKLQLITIDGDGDDFLVAYLVTDSETFQAWRWNMANGDFDAQAIAADVTDFGVDRNFPVATGSMRVSATYIKSGVIHSARSTAGSHGFDWVDEFDFGTTTSQLDFTYGRAGAYYTTYVGGVTGNLYTRANSSFNDPASWETRQTLEDGSLIETADPKIIATRKVIGSDEVLVITSSKDVGSGAGYNHQSYKRENGGNFSSFATGIALPNQSIAHIDAWIRKGTDLEEIVTSYTVDIIDESQNNVGRNYMYDGTSFTMNEAVSDSSIDVWNGFATAVAETSDEMPCMAFAGTNGGFGYGLYFDAKSEIVLNTQDTVIDGLTYYPNPVRDILHIRANDAIQEVRLVSLTGATVLEKVLDATTAALDLSNVASGVYLLQVASQNSSGTFKIVKQ